MIWKFHEFERQVVVEQYTVQAEPEVRRLQLGADKCRTLHTVFTVVLRGNSAPFLTKGR